MKAPKPTVSKNIKAEPIKWSVTHPDGHMYSMKKLDSLLARFNKTQAQLKKLGWKFEAHYE